MNAALVSGMLGLMKKMKLSVNVLKIYIQSWEDREVKYE